jgi:1-phosphatidylinositol-4-phosphate 5-kinase
MLFKAKESEGKSGSFMFQSYDKRFIIKTMNKSEQQVMVKMLPSYLNYLINNQDSLIARIYGIFTVHMEDQAEIHILLMGNLFENVNARESEFDLKGSIINRECNHYDINKCLKDVNLQVISKEL